jgi:hypothetical protein
MKPKNTLLGVAILYCLNSSAQSIDFVLHFDKGSDQLIPTEKQNLENWALSHYHFKGEPIVLRGHTDEDADSKYNMDLSARRNRAVYTLLKMQGFSNITYKDFGESWPLCQENNEVCLAQNRRVEVLLLEDIDEKWAENISTTAPQVQFIDPAENHIVKGKEGTQVVVPKNGFIREDGSEAEKVRIEIREYYSVASCLKNNISTMCGDKILESGGMVEIKAFDENDRELKISGDNSPKISFKNEAEKQEGMQLFYGVVENGVMNWSETPVRTVNTLVGTLTPNLGAFIYADQGSIVCLYDPKLGWVSILVTDKNRKEFNKIREKIPSKRTSEEIEKLKNWFEDSQKLEKMNIESLQRSLSNKMRIDSLEMVKAMKKMTKAEQAELKIRQKKEQDYMVASSKISQYFALKGSGFINCDRFFSSPKLPFTIEIADAQAASIYVVIKNINSVIVQGTRPTEIGCSTHLILPVGVEVDIIVLGYLEGAPLFGKKTLKIDERDKSIPLEVKSQTPEQIDKELGLFNFDI